MLNHRVADRPILMPTHFRPLASSCSTALCLLLTGSALAQVDPYFSSLPSVLTVSRLPQPIADAPGSVTVLDRDIIRASGVRYLSDLMRLVPGFQVAAGGTEAARVTYHGLAEEYPARLQVLIDGRSQYSGIFTGGVNWDILPVALEDIDRIEVLRGSNAAAYGSNAVMGVINIITLDAAQVKGYSVSATAGSQGVEDRLLRWGGEAGDMHLRMTWQEQKDGGISINPNSRNSSLFSLRGNQNLNSTDELDVQLGMAESNVFRGALNSTGNPWRPTRERTTFAQLGWRRVQDSDNEISVRYAHTQDQLWDYSMVIDPNYQAVMDANARSTRDELELQNITRLNDALRLVWGGSASLEKVSGTSLFNQGEQQRRIERLFGNLEWQAHPRWLLNVGSTLEHNSLGSTTFSPRVNANYRLLPEQTLRFGVSRSYRTPSLYEMRGDLRYAALPPVNINGLTLSDRQYFGNPLLKPEEVTTYEIGYLGDFKHLRSSLDVRIFQENIPNVIRTVSQPLSPGNCDTIDYPDCGKADSSFNAQHVKIEGIEYQWRWQPFDETKLIFSQAHIRIKTGLNDYPIGTTDINDQNKLLTQAIHSAPSRSSSLMLMQKLPYGIDASVMYYTVDAIKWSLNTSNTAYKRLDYRLAYPFQWGQKRAEVSYTAQSVNATNQEFRWDQIVQPRHWISLKLEM